MKKRYTIPLSIIGFMVLINIIAHFSRGFSDFYVLEIFPYISGLLSFISGLFPFSVGEIMIIIALALIIIGIPIAAILLIFMKTKRKKILEISACISSWIMAYIVSVMTLNCFIMYQCTPFSERYYDSEEHPRSQLVQLYSLLIDKTNSLADEVNRNENGYFILTDDVNSNAKTAMQYASEKYHQLKGYYPDAKKIYNSYFMSQSGLMGIYFPFSLEANYNKDMYAVNLPNTICHEYAHLKGIIQEDEAGFIAFIASTQSSSTDFRYSGYMNALEYVHNQIYKNEIIEGYYLTETISEKVKKDWFTFLPDDYWEVNKEKEIISTETVDTISSSLTDASLKLNGVKDGVESYSRIVDLLLDYYF